jgi:hypothetical protein
MPFGAVQQNPRKLFLSAVDLEFKGAAMRREHKWFIGIVIGVLISASLAAAASHWWHESPRLTSKISFAQ